MSYNRWMPPEYSTELYHHGVKGMKWGKHLFGKGTEIQTGAGGGGGGDAPDDEEWKEALEKYKRGEISSEELKAISAKRDQAYAEYYKKIQSLPYRLTHEPLDVLNSAAVKTIRAASDAKDAVTHPGETASKAIHTGQDIVKKAKQKLSGKPKEKKVNENAGKVSSGSKDLDARTRTYIAEGRDRYRKNGKYRNMNASDVYGENSKANNKAGRDGYNLYKDITITDVHDGKNYSTRDFDKSKYNDGRYKTIDKVREKITGKADPDNLKNVYNKHVRDTERVATQTQAYSVGNEESDIRRQAKKAADKEEKWVQEHSLAGLVSRKKKRR